MLDKSDWIASASSSAITRPSAEIFIVDDEPIISELLSEVFSSEGYQVTTFIDGEAFKAVAQSREPLLALFSIFSCRVDRDLISSETSMLTIMPRLSLLCRA